MICDPTLVVFYNYCGYYHRMTKILRIDSSARHDGSASRELATRLIERLGPDTDVKVRDLAAGVPLLSESTLDRDVDP